MGYHKSEIKKGVFGEISKIQEELDELKDAQKQDCKILAACELADLYGAIRAYAKHLGFEMRDLESMCNLTESAFLDGTRSSDSREFGIFWNGDEPKLDNALLVGTHGELVTVLNDSKTAISKYIAKIKL